MENLFVKLAKEDDSSEKIHHEVRDGDLYVWEGEKVEDFNKAKKVEADTSREESIRKAIENQK